MTDQTTLNKVAQEASKQATLAASVGMFNDRILVLKDPDPSDRVSQGGIILPGSDKQASMFGTVIAVGPGAPSPSSVKDRITPRVSVGDRIAFGLYVGTNVKIGTVNYLVLRDDDLLLRLPATT